MIGNKLEQSIISVFQNDLSSTYSINEISKILKKSYPNINLKANYFLKEGVLKKIDIGRSYRCYLNLSNEKAKIFMSINELNAREEFLENKPEIAKVYWSIAEALTIYAVELAIICNKRFILVAPKDSERQLQSHLKDLMPAGYSISVADLQSFKRDFLENKELLENHIILSSINGYLEIISDLNEKLLMKGLLGRGTQ